MFQIVDMVTGGMTQPILSPGKIYYLCYYFFTTATQMIHSMFHIVDIAIKVLRSLSLLQLIFVVYSKRWVLKTEVLYLSKSFQNVVFQAMVFEVSSFASIQ